MLLFIFNPLEVVKGLITRRLLRYNAFDNTPLLCHFFAYQISIFSIELLLIILSSLTLLYFSTFQLFFLFFLSSKLFLIFFEAIIISFGHYHLV